MSDIDLLLEKLTERVIDLQRDLDEAVALMNRTLKLVDDNRDSINDVTIDLDELTDRVRTLEGEE